MGPAVPVGLSFGRTGVAFSPHPYRKLESLALRQNKTFESAERASGAPHHVRASCYRLLTAPSAGWYGRVLLREVELALLAMLGAPLTNPVLEREQYRVAELLGMSALRDVELIQSGRELLIRDSGGVR